MRRPGQIILASASPQRKKLLRSMGLRFRVVPSGVPEPVRGRDWRKLARDLAIRKARSVARKHPDALVVGADTVVVCSGELLLKPRSRAHSLRMLESLSGRWHRVHTGVALVWKKEGIEKSGVATTRCLARKLDDARLAKLAGKHMDKSGSYAVQDKKDPLISKLDGPKDNVIGFPRALFKKLVRNAGVKLAAVLLLASASARAETRDRIASLAPLVSRVGLEVRAGGSSVGWPGGADMKEPKLGAALDELEYLGRLKEGVRRTGTDHFLTDLDRHRLDARYFAPELAGAGVLVIEEQGAVAAEGRNGRLAHGALDLYLRKVEACAAAGTPPPPPRALRLELGAGRRWQPAALDASAGEWVSLTLANPSADGTPAGFSLEGYVGFRESPGLGATIAAFAAERAGDFAYYDPAFRESGEGVLHVR